jgi:hypothetical protein
MSQYKINNTLLLSQPETGRWVNRSDLGMDGAGHPVYPALREYELNWGYMDTAELYQLQSFYELVGNSGTVSVDLPEHAAGVYGFHTYSGCTLSEPQFSNYFEEHYSDVKLIIYKVTG